MAESDQETRAGGAESTLRPAGLESTLASGGTVVASQTGQPGYSNGAQGLKIRAGDRLEHFVVEHELGTGAMGVVLAARDPDLNRRVAIKLVRPKSDAPPTEAAQVRMLREAQSMAKVTHPNVVAVHQVGFSAGQLFIAMEFIDGRTLRQWGKERVRSLAEVLTVFRAAGEGLAAAHAVGLVHRDFKPDNVLVARNDRVAVTDFGLVSIAGAADEQTTEVGRTAESLGASADLALTETGSVMGTPAYMAAEQHHGRPVDARADQFAFCVALWEALYGRRPFHRDTMGALVHATLQGVVDEPSGPPAIRGSVPTAIRRAIERGLRPDPQARWPTMRALLDQLHYDPSATARWVAIGLGGALALGALSAAAYWALQPDGPSCDGGSDKVAEVWNDDRRGLLNTALTATGVAAADAAAASIGQRLDAWAEEWEAGYRDACEATVVRGEQSQSLLDQRMRCLERGRDDVRLLLDALISDPGSATVSKAPGAAAIATSIAQCHSDRLALDHSQNISVANLADAQALRSRIDAALIEYRLGHINEALESLEGLAGSANELGEDLVTAELLFHTGRLQAKSSRPGDSEATLHRAVAKAADADAPGVEAASLLALADTVGSHLGDPKRALGILAGAESEIREAADSALDAQYQRTLGGLQYMTQQHEESERSLRKALELDHAADEDRSLSLSLTYNVLAVLLGDLGRSAEALAAHEEALTHTVAHYGASHPNLAMVRNNRAAQYRVLGRRDEARNDHVRALEILRATVGEQHPWMGVSYEGLGILAQEEGDLETAREYHLKAKAVREAAYGSSHVVVASSIHNLASLQLLAGKPAEAGALWLEARKIWVDAYGGNHPSIADADLNLGRATFLAGDLEGAQRWFASALQISQAAYGAEHPQLVLILASYAETLQKSEQCDQAAPLLARGREIAAKHGQEKSLNAAALISVEGWCALSQGQTSAALTAFNESIAIHEANPHEPYSMALELYGKAKALALLGRAREARDFAEQVRKKAKTAGPVGQQLIDELEVWLATLH